MTNSKLTRRALFTSIMALVLCFAMLTGTTFAWFTDQETSGNNQIIAGNLDVALYHTNDKVTTPTKVTTSTKLFDNIDYWEPGAVAYENLKVVNEGNLALKYQISVNFEDAGLANALKVAVIDPIVTGTSRADVIAAADGKWQSISTFSTDVEHLVNKDDAKEYGVVIYWQPSDNDNAYNANNGSTDKYELELGVAVFATQLDAENDAFGKDYDEDALYADYYVRTAAEFDAAMASLKENEVIALYAGAYTLPMNDTWWKATDLPKNVTIVGAEDGVKITPVSNGSTEVGEQGRIQAEGYTFKNVTFTNTVSPSGYGTFIDCTFDGYNGLRHGAYKQDTKFVNCKFNNADGWAFHTEYLYGADVYFEKCIFNGLVEFTDTVDETNKVHFTDCAFVGSNRTSSGKIFYAWKNNAVITDCAGYDANLFEGCEATGDVALVKSSTELKNAITAGKKEVFAVGAEFDEKVSLGVEIEATFVDCEFTGNNAWGYVKNATYEGCTFDSAEAAMHFDRLYGELYVKDCYFKAGKVQIGTDGDSSAIFENCTFGETTTTSIWAEKGMRVYCPTSFINCEFNNRVVLAGSNGLALTFEGCTMNGGSPVYYVDNTDGIIRGGNIPAVTIK